jgi:hypothetical protein
MKATGSKSIVIPAELAARCDGPDQFEKFDQLFRKVIAVPHSAIVKAEAKWKRERKNRTKRTKAS